MMDPSIPKNEGFFNSIDLIVPEGCCLNPPPNKSVAAGTHHPGTEVGEAIAKALEQVIPERCCPQIYKMGMPTVIFGTQPADRAAVHRPLGGHLRRLLRRREGAGRLGGDERQLRQPHPRHRRDQREHLPGAPPGGATTPPTPAGRASGAAVRARCYVKQILAPAQVYTYVVGRKYPMPGIAGGGHGRAQRAHLRAGTPREQLVETTAFYVPHEPGDRYEYRYGGGGGWGDPLARDPQAVLDDVLDEYVSVEGARRDYGVVLTGTLEALDLAIDHGATTALRAERRASTRRRKGAE